MAPYKILRQGYMEKEPPVSKRGIRKKLFRYWFVLVEDKKQVALVYFKNEDHYIARQRNEGFIRIDEAESISVVGQFMGRKHVFVIKTPKGEYILFPESRYDLHEWLFILHNALEAFKKKKEKLKQRLSGARPRSNTVDSGHPQGGSHRTPPHTPTRHAPPPPTGQEKRRPSRPAPGPPQRPHSTEDDQAQAFVGETPPPSYMESDAMSQDTSTHDLMMDLEISQVDRDIHDVPLENGLPHQEQPHPLNEEPHPLDDGGPYPFNEPDGILDHPSNLLHQTSSSLPDLLAHEEDTPTTTPEEEPANEQGQEGKSPKEARKGSSSSYIRHTRHHSLTITEIKSKKKRSSRRQGSIKLRSRSPPELPPPPPPEQETTHPDPAPSLEPAQNGVPPSGNSTASLGFSGVMDTISDVERQIDEMSDEFSPKPAQGSENRSFPFSVVHTPNPVPEQPETGEGFNEEEWLCDEPPTEPPPAFRETDHTPLTDEVRQGMLASPENAQVETVHAPVPVEQHRKTNKQVMFKEEVEDIPMSTTYEPVADDDSEDDEDPIPSSVAELKKRLFGEQEREAARYKREGPLSPKYTHPVNVTFEEDYHFQREISPNINNNNSGGETEASNYGNSDEKNVYDKPWDSKAITTRPVQKEPTPPPVAPKPVTQPVDHTPSESVASGWSQSFEQESLLNSISNTLQETSKYGSDSFLSMEAPPKKKSPEVRFSSKGELEKIRAEHRREPVQQSPGASPKRQRNSPPQQRGSHLQGSSMMLKNRSPSHQKVNGQSPQRNFSGPPRNAASLDALRETKPNTQVTYNANTNSHVFRSLV